MPDISLCANFRCKARGDCFRYLAEPSPYRQTYTEYEPEEGHDSCNALLEVKLWDGYRIRSLVNVDRKYKGERND